MPRPICVKCETEYRPKQNGVTAEEIANFGSYKLWMADLWECPKCGHLLISGFGRNPVREHFMPDYEKFKEPPVFKFYES